MKKSRKRKLGLKEIIRSEDKHTAHPGRTNRVISAKEIAKALGASVDYGSWGNNLKKGLSPRFKKTTKRKPKK